MGGDPSYVVRIVPDGMDEPVRTAPLAQAEYVYTPVLSVDDGGPWRSLRVDVLAVNEAGESPAGSLTVSDTPPAVIGSFQGVVSATSVTLSGITVTEEYTGFVLVRGGSSDFDVSGIVESRVVNALPYIWGGLAPATQYYFRIAPKDAFFDVAGDFESLTYSDVITITTEAS